MAAGEAARIVGRATVVGGATVAGNKSIVETARTAGGATVARARKRAHERFRSWRLYIHMLLQGQG